MQIHLKGYGLYGFDLQKTSGARYIAKTLKQAKNIESMMKTTWNKKAIRCQNNATKMLNWPLSITGKEAKHMHALLFFDWC